MNRRYEIEVEGWKADGTYDTRTFQITAPDESAPAAIEEAVERAKGERVGIVDIGGAKCVASQLLGWAVMTEQGLTCWVNLTEEEAREVASQPTPSGTPQVAVPERVAEVAAAEWKSLQTVYDGKLAAARLEATKRILDGFSCSQPAKPYARRYDIFNENRVRVDTISAKDGKHALADFLSRGYGSPEATRARREHVIANAVMPSQRGAATFDGVTAVRVADKGV